MLNNPEKRQTRESGFTFLIALSNTQSIECRLDIRQILILGLRQGENLKVSDKASSWHDGLCDPGRRLLHGLVDLNFTMPSTVGKISMVSQVTGCRSHQERTQAITLQSKVTVLLINTLISRLRVARLTGEVNNGILAATVFHLPSSAPHAK